MSQADEKKRKDNIHALVKLIVYDDIIRTQVNALSVAKAERGRGIYSYLLSMDEAFHMEELIKQINSDDFIDLIKKTALGNKALDKFSYFGYRNYDDSPVGSEDRFKEFIDDLKDKTTGLLYKLEGEGVERKNEGGYTLNCKKKNSIYILNKWIAARKLHFLMEEIEYAIKDFRYNYAAELMFYAGRLYEKANVVAYESHTIRGIKTIISTSEGGKAKGRKNFENKALYQSEIDKYLTRNPKHSYTQARIFVAKKYHPSISARQLSRLTKNPRRK